MKHSNLIFETALHFLNTEGISAERAGLDLFVVNGEVCTGVEHMCITNEWRALDGLAPFRETDE